MIQFLFMSKEQTHPLHATDRNIIDSLITKEKPEDLDFINLARLINRYTDFPGEIEIKNDIDKILKFWKITKINFFQKQKIFGQKASDLLTQIKIWLAQVLIPQIKFYLHNFSSINKCLLIYQTLKS